jgi:transcriptional regulator with XRE-family HTH domain
MMITPAQSRAARGLTNITQAQLAAASGVSLRTIAHFEKGERQPIPTNLAAIRAALEAAGVVFLADGEVADGGPGVRLKGEAAQ